MPDLIWLIVWFVFQLQCGIGCIVVAESKNRNAFGWFMYGLLFGVIGLLMAIGVTPLPGPEPETAQRRLRRAA